MINCPYKWTVYFYGEYMDLVINVFVITLLASCTIRHIVRTMSFILDWRLKVENRAIERFKH